MISMPGEPNWNQNDIVRLRASRINDKNFTNEFEVRLKYNGAIIGGPGYGAFDGGFTILTISSNMRTVSILCFPPGATRPFA